MLSVIIDGASNRSSDEIIGLNFFWRRILWDPVAQKDDDESIEQMHIYCAISIAEKPWWSHCDLNTRPSGYQPDARTKLSYGTTR